MAARIRKIRHDEETRLKIQTSQLVNRLTDHVLGKIEMQGTQVTAALGLLKKSLPDLQATTLKGDAENPLIPEHSDRDIAKAVLAVLGAGVKAG